MGMYMSLFLHKNRDALAQESNASIVKKHGLSTYDEQINAMSGLPSFYGQIHTTLTILKTTDVT
jgi:hypothetical protein